MKFVVLLGPTGTGFSATSPDVPGVLATGNTVEQTLSRFKAAVEVKIKVTRERGGELPVPQTIAATIEVEDVA